MKTYTVVHVIDGEKPSIMYQITREQLTNPKWVCNHLFNWEYTDSQLDVLNHDCLTAKECIVDQIVNNPNAKVYIFEGDSGYIFILETGLTIHYETISL